MFEAITLVVICYDSHRKLIHLPTNSFFSEGSQSLLLCSQRTLVIELFITSIIEANELRFMAKLVPAGFLSLATGAKSKIGTRECGFWVVPCIAPPFPITQKLRQAASSIQAATGLWAQPLYLHSGFHCYMGVGVSCCFSARTTHNLMMDTSQTISPRAFPTPALGICLWGQNVWKLSGSFVWSARP